MTKFLLVGRSLGGKGGREGTREGDDGVGSAREGREEAVKGRLLIV